MLRWRQDSILVPPPGRSPNSSSHRSPSTGCFFGPPKTIPLGSNIEINILSSQPASSLGLDSFFLDTVSARILQFRIPPLHRLHWAPLESEIPSGWMRTERQFDFVKSHSVYIYFNRISQSPSSSLSLSLTLVSHIVVEKPVECAVREPNDTQRWGKWKRKQFDRISLAHLPKMGDQYRVCINVIVS